VARDIRLAEMMSGQGKPDMAALASPAARLKSPLAA
jgi:hypothetical protein